MRHKGCGGLVTVDVDAYRCDKCRVGWKCVGQEQYLRDVVEAMERDK